MSEAVTSDLFVLGTTHATAPLEFRERVALQEADVPELYERLEELAGVRECLVLNTCNRVEFYLVAQAAEDLRAEVTRLLCEARGLPEDAFAPHAFWLRGEAAATHAFEVAAGLDSQMVGETEIFGQVKDAYANAEKREALGPVLNRVFQRSFQAAKWVRTHTGVGRGQVSIGNVVADLTQRICGDLADVRILLAGSGEAGQRVAQSLVSRGARTLTVTSRRFERARVLADELGGVAVDFRGFTKQLWRYDVVIGSTAAPGIILTAESIDAAMHERPTVPLFLIDLAVPRDFEAAAGDIGNVYLFNLDDLSALSNENLRARRREVEKARKTLAERAARVWSGLQEPRHQES